MFQDPRKRFAHFCSDPNLSFLAIRYLSQYFSESVPVSHDLLECIAALVSSEEVPQEWDVLDGILRTLVHDVGRYDAADGLSLVIKASLRSACHRFQAAFVLSNIVQTSGCPT